MYLSPRVHTALLTGLRMGLDLLIVWLWVLAIVLAIALRYRSALVA